MTLQIEIFDVDHGQCSMVHCPSGRKIMIDAGHNTSRSWFPSTHFSGQNIELFINTNLDEDHMSDFEDVMRYCNVKAVFKNWTIDSARLKAMKPMGMGPGITHAYNWMREIEAPNGVVWYDLADLGGVVLSRYYNPYGTFTDANNLSVATFVTYGDFCILFPGDLEVAGWKKLLENPAFCADLAKVKVLVASHHGRENGCCSEMFQYCKPLLVVISDDGIEYSTQETGEWYAYYASGAQSIGQRPRKVMTTRSDGHITIEVTAPGFTAQTMYLASEAERDAQRLARVF